MRTVLCYGDSNTWGAATVARPDDRYAPDERWPGVLRAELGPDWLVIEEGLGGRTTVSDDPVEWNPDKNGARYPAAVPPHPQAARRCRDHARHQRPQGALQQDRMGGRRKASACWSISSRPRPSAASGGTPEIIVICPPVILDRLPLHPDLFAGAPAKSRDMAKHYRAVADRARRPFPRRRRGHQVERPRRLPPRPGSPPRPRPRHRRGDRQDRLQIDLPPRRRRLGPRPGRQTRHNSMQLVDRGEVG